MGPLPSKENAIRSGEGVPVASLLGNMLVELLISKSAFFFFSVDLPSPRS